MAPEKFIYNSKDFEYTKGFHELAYLSNSPQAMIDSIITRPFVDHDAKKQTVKINNEVMEGIFYYQMMQEGCWFIYSDYRYKVNVNFKRLENPDIPSDYYIWGLEMVSGEEDNKPVLVNGIPYSHTSWVIFKPKVSTVRTHFKGSREVSHAVFFNQQWLEKELMKNQKFSKSALQKLFKSKAQYLIWPDTEMSTRDAWLPIQNFFNEYAVSEHLNIENLYKHANKLLFHFIGKYEKEAKEWNLFDISDKHRNQVVLAERVLTQSLYGPFIGIEKLAKQAGIAPTTLKIAFKKAFHQSIFSYFREKQMEIAKRQLQTEKIAIKEVAKQLGFENASKFASCFKSYIGMLPSEFIKHK